MVRKWTCFVPKHFRDAKKRSPFPTPLHCSLPCSVYKERKDSEALGESQSRFRFILWAVSFAPIPLSTFVAAPRFNSLFQMLSLLELSRVSILPEVLPSCCSVSSWFIPMPLDSKIALSAGKFTFGLGRKVSFWKGA